MNPTTPITEEIEMNPLTTTEREEEEMNLSTTTDMESIEDQNTKNQMHTIIIPSARLQTENLPCGDLLESRDDYFSICVPLYEASITGDWAAAKAIFDTRPELVRFSITEGYETALHVAASAEETKPTQHFVENLVEMMTRMDLELQNKSSNTAFCLAVTAGNLKMAMIMRKKNRMLLDIPGALGMMPLYMSATFGKYETVKYLYDASHNLTGDFWTHGNRGWLLQRCIECNFFDVALQILMDRPELAGNGRLLESLARKPDAFNRVEQTSLTRIIINSISRLGNKVGAAEMDSDALKLLKVIWRNTIRKMPKSEGDKILRGPADGYNTRDGGRIKYSSRILFVAAEMGNTKFVIQLLRAYPDLAWKTDNDNRSIFHIAVMHRHLDIYNLLYELGSQKHLITPMKDNDGNTMLHLIGETSVKMRSQTSGASLLIQRELLWYKEVEKMVPPYIRERKNKDGQTPYELFSEQTQDIVSHGLKWMRDCMVVATLIVTVAFAVAFTVPGGYNQEIGIPIFIHKPSFLVFVIADAISLFSSSTSLLVFLSILTSRHGQRDFIYSLPQKLMIGLVTLFISVAAMMVTFSASFFVLYRNGLNWVPILIAAFAATPVIIFGVLQFPLLVDMFRSMYDSRYLFNPKKRMLYNKKPRL